jgi:hypothetical protein
MASLSNVARQEKIYAKAGDPGQCLSASRTRTIGRSRVPSRSPSCGAIYLGGYVVECMLKWAICQRQRIIYLENLPDQKLPERLTGARGHDLNFLLEVSGLRPRLKLNRRLYDAFIQMSKWSVKLLHCYFNLLKCHPERSRGVCHGSTPLTMTN